MSVKTDPWQTAEIAGPKKALLILKPEVVVAMINRATRPILIIGHLAIENDSDDVDMIDYSIQLSNAASLPVVATAHTIKEFVKRGFTSAITMSAMDVGDRLVDPEWKGLDGEGPYDLALFIGLPYYMEFVLLSALKHFSTNLKTVSLDRFYNPHATWSFPNLSVKDWEAHFKVILNKVGGKK